MSGKQTAGKLPSKPTRCSARLKKGDDDGGADASGAPSVIDTLPLELLLHVFEYLDTRTLSVVVAGVCKTWRAVCGDTPRVCADLWFLARSVQIAPPPPRQLRSSSPLLGLASALSRFKLVESVLVPYDGDGIACAIANSCPRLSVVDFTDQIFEPGCVNPWLTDIGLVALAEHCLQLTSVNVREGWFTDAALMTLTLHCPRLTSLVVGGDRGGISYTGVRAISERFGSQLTTIHFSACYNLGDDEIIAVAEHCPHLSTVGFEESAITGTGLALLAQHCPRLTSVNLSICEELTDVDVAALVWQRPLLTSVSINSCEQLTDLAVVALTEKCRQLARVHVTGCSQLTDQSLIALGKHCPVLTAVDFSHCSVVTDVGVIGPRLSIAHTCRFF